MIFSVINLALFQVLIADNVGIFSSLSGIICGQVLYFGTLAGVTVIADNFLYFGTLSGVNCGQFW